MTEHKDLRANFIEITATDLPLQCPMPSMSKWNAHPRVYLPIINSTAMPSVRTAEPNTSLSDRCRPAIIDD